MVCQHNITKTIIFNYILNNQTYSLTPILCFTHTYFLSIDNSI